VTTETKQKLPQQKAPQPADLEDDGERQEPGAYDPAQFANLPVSAEIKEMFEYINRFKPQKIDLNTKIRPFIPEFIPAVGEVDAFLKMPKPDG
jgi:intraflagellar transport protein 46